MRSTASTRFQHHRWCGDVMDCAVLEKMAAVLDVCDTSPSYRCGAMLLSKSSRSRKPR